jgi:hypothetical protein
MLPELDETKHPFRNMILAPIWGLLFIMFLPLIGFVLVGKALATKAMGVIKDVTVQPSPAIGSAYLTGSETNKPSDDLAELEKEVAAKRQS